jgi:chemotaxis protein methyltransferase CheR
VSQPDARAAARQRLAASGLRLGEREERLLEALPIERLSRMDDDDLLAELTVTETSFFRDAAQFEALKGTIVPELVARRQGEPRPWVRVLSAGCASGEEAYSVAIVLEDALPRASEWAVSIVGLDVSPAALRRASEAVYGEWSLRGAAAEVRQRFFRPATAASDGRWRLVDPVRRRVAFLPANLAAGALPQVGLRLDQLDVVLCRNVLLYYEPEVRRRILARLVAMLAPEGWLLTGVADFPGGLAAGVDGCEAVEVGKCVAFRRARTGNRQPATGNRQPRRTAGALSLADVKGMADRGEIGAAISAVEAFVMGAPEDAGAHLLHGLLLWELGDAEAAFEALRRSLYLQPRGALGHYAASCVALQLGRVDVARRHLARARAIVHGAPEVAPVPGWDGMTAGRLERLVDEQARILEEPA